MTTVAVIQARCGSTRFPRKVLAPPQGRPMLAHVIERVSRAALVDRVVVATTDGPGDDEVAILAAAHDAGVTLGSKHDVLSRYVLAAREHIACERDLSWMQLTVDVPEDLVPVAALLAILPSSPPRRRGGGLRARPRAQRQERTAAAQGRYHAQRDAPGRQQTAG